MGSSADDQLSDDNTNSHGAVAGLRWSRGELESLDACPACRARCIYTVTYERGDDSGLMPDRWLIHRCAVCGSFYINPRMNETSMPDAYADYLTHDFVDSERIFTSDAVQWALVRGYLKWRFGLRTSLHTIPVGRWLFGLFEPWRLKLDRFGRHLTRARFPQPGRLLDVGCGAGDFLQVAVAMGWSACGCDPDGKVVEMCGARGLDVRQGGAEAWFDERGLFDAITLNQVIEHVHDPQALLRQCFHLLKPGGVLWLGFPNARSFGAHVFGPSWAGLHPPYHLCLPAQPVLRKWLLAAGYERIVLQRRGAHARANWRNSRVLTERFKEPLERYLKGEIGQILSDVLATFSPRWGEETVALARRPRG